MGHGSSSLRSAVRGSGCSIELGSTLIRFCLPYGGVASPEAHLAEFIATTEWTDVPDEARNAIQRAVLDTVGVTIAGAVDDAGQTVFKRAGVNPSDTGLAVLLGFSGSDSPAERALRTGTAAHALDYDDLSWVIDGHPSITLVPPLFALAEQTAASGSDVMTAYAVGFETMCAIAAPISPEHYEQGWHATATFGTFGATATAAALLDLGRSETQTALNLAASMPAGTKRNFGSQTKPIHAGLCSRSGVTAAQLAADGATANETAISGTEGFWDLYGGEVDEFTFQPSQWRLETDGIHTKRYPCCYFTHTSIAATHDIVADHSIDPERIERIRVRAAQGAADALPYADPQTPLEAKFSMPYTVASAALDGRVTLDTFTQSAIGNPAVQRLQERVGFTTADDLAYDAHEATVQIDTSEHSYRRTRTNPPWVHTDPPTHAEQREKFRECATRVVTREKAQTLCDRLQDFASIGNVAEELPA